MTGNEVPAAKEPSRATPRWLRGDSVAVGLLSLAGLTLLQRSVGLLRNVWFCRVLDDDQLGRWSLAYHFLLVAAPLVVLGLPGSFGRYVERYRQRGQLRRFLVRTGAACLAVALVGFVGLHLGAPWVARGLFGDAERVALVRILATTLILVTAFNFLVELLTSLRLIRLASLMQFVCSLGFALWGVMLLTWTPLREEAVMLAYAGGALCAALVGLAVVVWYWQCLPQDTQPLSTGALWGVLLPFAGWIWAWNLVSNLFEVADQFMLKYFSGLPPLAADSLVGQYYSSRVIPLLLISVAAMLAGSLLPHMTRDWEAGRRAAAGRRLNMFVKLAAIVFTLGAACCLLGSPILFTWALQGKYDGGLAVLPGTLAYCACYGIGCLAMNYLLCAEKAPFACLVWASGLAFNVVLNLLLVPRFGLPGVVVATFVANGVALVAIFRLCSGAGMQWQFGTLVAAALPISLWLGGGPALGIVAVVLAVGCWERWLVSEQELAAAREFAVLLLTRWKGGGDRTQTASTQV